MERAAAKPVMLTQAQAEAIGRLQLIQLVGLELEKLVGEYRSGRRGNRGIRSDPPR